MFYTRPVRPAPSILPLMIMIVFGCNRDPINDDSEVSTEPASDAEENDTSTESDTSVEVVPCAFRESVLPAPAGPFCVGVTDYHWIDPDRPEPYTPDDDADTREVMVRIFYPAPSAATEAYGDYASEAVLQAFAEVLGLEDLEEILADVPVQSRLEASLADAAEPFPVVLFSPGLGSVFQVSTALLEDLASRGYVVVAVNHPYISAITEFPDGRVIIGDLLGDETDHDKNFALLPGDLQLVLDEVLALNAADPSDRFTDRLDPSRIGAFGHSLGGAAALALLDVDQRVIAGIDMDGSLHAYDSDGGPIDRAVMFHLAGSDEPAFQPEMIDFWGRLEGPGYAVFVPEAGHYSYVDLPVFLVNFFPDESLEDWTAGTVDPVRMTALVSEYNAAFFEAFLRDGEVDTVGDLANAYPEVTLLVASEDEIPEQDMFTCKDGSEMFSDWECDGAEDCADGSDEHDGCEYFECASGESISVDWECDGEEDCADGSDEHADCVFS